MKAYILTTGVLFGAITLAHVLRMIEEGSRLMSEPWYLLLTLAALALCLWAVRLLYQARRS